MIIEFNSSPSNFVVLSCHVSHLQAFEVKHCLNPRAKKVVYYPDVLKSLKFGQSATQTQSVHGMVTL